MIYYALLMFFVVDYVRPGNYIPGLDALRLNTLVPIVAFLGTLTLKAPVSNQQFFSETNTKLLASLIGLLVLSTLFATVTMNAYGVTKDVSAYVLIYWVIVRQVGDTRRLNGLLATLAGIHVVIAVLNPGLFTDPDSRVGINSGAFLGDGNDFALSVNICVPLCLFLLFEANKTRHKVFWALALLLMVLLVVATKSRGGTLALVAIGVYFWLKSSRKVLTACLAIAAVVIILVSAPPLYFERMATMADTEESSAQGRITAWKAGMAMAVANPMLGAGAGHFPMAYGHANQGRWMTAHSIYFLILGELGLPGIIVLIALISSNLMANRRLLREVKRRLPPERASTSVNVLSCTSAALVGFAVGGAFLSAVYYPHMYVLCGMMVASRRMVRNEIAVEARADQEGKQRLAPLTPVRPLQPHGISPEWQPRPAMSLTLAGGTRPDRRPS